MCTNERSCAQRFTKHRTKCLKQRSIESELNKHSQHRNQTAELENSVNQPKYHYSSTQITVSKNTQASPRRLIDSKSNSPFSNSPTTQKKSSRSSKKKARWTLIPAGILQEYSALGAEAFLAQLLARSRFDPSSLRRLASSIIAILGRRTGEVGIN
ncbi:hypothetical protein KM043_003645 [Ampulex compressa]|nr:hypothetical protein KM043_003645 [Ampulex compressa]